jgi:hypothetical protein
MYKFPLSLVAIAGFGIATPALLSGSAEASDSAHSGVYGASANAIVGLWSTEGDVGLCGSDPINKVFNTLLFHAGGTLVENPRIPPAGVPDVGGGIYQRGQALGTWTFDPRYRTYQVHLRFDNYVDNAYHGYTMVDREITLTGKDQAAGPVYVTRFTADGNLIVELCGQAVSTRL